MSKAINCWSRRNLWCERRDVIKLVNVWVHDYVISVFVGMHHTLVCSICAHNYNELIGICASTLVHVFLMENIEPCVFHRPHASCSYSPVGSVPGDLNYESLIYDRWREELLYCASVTVCHSLHHTLLKLTPKWTGAGKKSWIVVVCENPDFIYEFFKGQRSIVQYIKHILLYWSA